MNPRSGWRDPDNDVLRRELLDAAIRLLVAYRLPQSEALALVVEPSPPRGSGASAEVES